MLDRLLARLRVRGKLAASFSLVLLPVLAVLVAGIAESHARQRATVLDSELLTAQALGAHIEEALDAALALGQAVASAPVVQRLDPEELDSYLTHIVARLPKYVALTVYDERGVNRGWGDPMYPAEPRISIAVHPYFSKVMVSGEPMVSEVHEFQRPARVVGFVACVPIPGPTGKPRGVVVLRMPAAVLAARWKEARLLPDQAIFLTDPSGQLAFHTATPNLSFAQSVRFSETPSVQAALRGAVSQADAFVPPWPAAPALTSFNRTPKYGWLVGVSLPRAVAFASVHRQMVEHSLVFFALVALCGFLVATLTRWLSGPVRALARRAEELGRGDALSLLEIRSGDELEELGRAFNQMSLQLQRRTAENAQLCRELRDMLRLREEFLRAAAHELKTPITTIKLWSSALLKSETVPLSAHHALESVLRQTARLGRLVEQLNVLKQLRSQQVELHREPLDLVRLVARQAGALERGAPDTSVRLDAQGPLRVMADPALLEEVVTHLLEHGLTHAAQLPAIDVVLRREGAQVRVHGPAIDPERQRHLFEPFYPPFPPGARGYVGTASLGLHLSKLIVDAHGGRMGVFNESGGGSTFWFSLPLALESGPLAVESGAPVH